MAAAPLARVRARRPAPTAELSLQPTRRASTSAIETSPFRHLTSPIVVEPDERFGPYLVYEQLGEGGMARVHRAELVGTAGFRKAVALKRMRTVTSEDPDFVTSFIHEGQLIGKLEHPNIARAYELGKIDGVYYIAMELVPGPNLAQVIAQARRLGGTIPLPIVLEILVQLCDALEHAHDLRDEGGRSLGLIHRDISPMNVIVSRAGTAKLIDFGIAKVRGSCVETQAGIIKGKHAYVAPEYTLGLGLDRRVDLWGLGVVAHEMLTGRRLFLGESEGDTIRNVRLMQIPPPSQLSREPISPELDDIVLTALERDPDQRWQNAGAMRTALTAEARRQRVIVSGAQIRDWIDWAFRQPTDDDADGAPVRHALAEPSIEITRDPDDVPTVDAGKPPAKIVIARDVLPRSVIPRLPTAATAPIHLSCSETAIPSLRPPSLALADTADAIPEPIAPAGTYKIPRRAPRWNPPTRWTRERRRVPWPQLIVLAMLLAFAAMSVQLGWIDVARWQALL